MDSKAVLTRQEALLVEALRCAIHGEGMAWDPAVDDTCRESLYRLARAHALAPLLAQALWTCDPESKDNRHKALYAYARNMTVGQAARTSTLLLLLEGLSRHGLEPVVLKGLICRALYPEPEQRASTDEDLLIRPEDFPRYHEALLACGMRLTNEEAPLDKAEEVSYVDPYRVLYVELHLYPFSPEDPAYGDCCRMFDGALDRAVTIPLFGRTVRTLHPTDHMLFLICHAYKHILYSGVGLRQICDICLFARHYAQEIDWDRVRSACGELGMLTLAAAFFRIGEQHLGIPGPENFTDLQPEELPLLHDCITGGLYGAEGPDRIHSSTLTLDAVSAQRQGRRRKGLLSALFPPVKSLTGRYPCLYRRPWLLPLAWAHRFITYLFRKDKSAGNTMQIARERIALLQQYDILK